MEATLLGGITHLIDLSNTTLFVALGDHVSVSEILGFLTGAISVWLCVKLNVWNWPVGIANSAFFLILFWAAGLYANSLLQVVYIALAIWGWWAWVHGGAGRAELPVTRTTASQWLWLTGFGVVTTAGLFWLLTLTGTANGPVFDASTTALSLMATWGQCLKKVESWYLWIAVDLIYVPYFAFHHLGLTAVLYVLFLGMCVVGLRDWKAEAKAQAGTAQARPEPAGTDQQAGEPAPTVRTTPDTVLTAPRTPRTTR